MSLGQVCKKFYDISCNLKSFRLRLGPTQPNGSYVNFLQDDEIFKMMMNSKRKIFFFDITIKSCDIENLENIHKQRLAKVVEKFGKDVTQFQTHSVDMFPCFTASLNLMPNLKEIYLSQIDEEEVEDMEIVELSLNHLKYFYSSRCSERVLKIFNQLTPGVLQRIQLRFYDEYLPEVNRSIELFRNQHNVKDVWVNTRFVKLMNLKEMKLTSLRLHVSKISLNGIINGQSEMKSLNVGEGIFKNELKVICNELTALEELDISVFETASCEFSELSKLSHLEKLKISFVNIENSTFNESLSVLENKNLLELEIYNNYCELEKSTACKLGLNCPQLEILSVSNSTLNIINPIIENCSNLKVLKLDSKVEAVEEPFMFRDGLKHFNLKKLQLMGPKTCNEDFIKLINCFDGLKKLKTSVQLNYFHKKQIQHLRKEKVEISRNLDYFW